MSSWKDDAKQDLKDAKRGVRYKLEEGESTFRLLASKKGANDPPYRVVNMHHGVGPEEMSMRCGKDKDGKGKCWLCDVKLPQLQASENPNKRSAAKRMQAKKSLVVQVSPVADGKFGAPLPWSMDVGGAKAASSIVLSLLSSTRRSYEDLDKGYSITLERSGIGLKTTYGVPQPDEQPSKVPTAIRVKMKELDELLTPYDGEKQKRAYLGQPLDDKDGDDEGLTSKPRGGKKAKREVEAEEPDEADADAEEGEEGEPDADEAEEDAEAEDADAEAEDDEAEEDAEAEDDEAEEPEPDEDEPVEDDEELEPEEEDEEPPPPPKKKTAAAPPPKKKVPPPPPPKKKVKR